MCFLCMKLRIQEQGKKSKQSRVRPAALAPTGFLTPASSAVALHTRLRRNSDRPAHLQCAAMFARTSESKALSAWISLPSL